MAQGLPQPVSPLAWQLPRLGQGPCGFGAAAGAPGLGSARGSPRAAVYRGCPPSLRKDQSPASACVPSTASPLPTAEAPPASPRQRVMRRGRHGAVQPGGLPAEQRPWRGPSGGEGSGRKAALVPRARPARRKRVGGQEGRPAAGPSSGMGTGAGAAGEGHGRGVDPGLPFPCASPARQQCLSSSTGTCRWRGGPGELGSSPNPGREAAAGPEPGHQVWLGWHQALAGPEA